MVGLIAFANDGGLGIQTKRLYKMLKPDKVLLIDSRGFSKNKQLHTDWYPNAQICTGFPQNHEILPWLEGLKTVFMVEDPYNYYIIHACHERGIKTIVQTNYEFCDNLVAPWLPVPDLFLMPSYWKLEEMKRRFGDDRVIYLPPPIDPEEFANVTPHKGVGTRFLHIVGTLAAKDRNGTQDLLKAMAKTKEMFRLTIHSQHPLPESHIIDDPRITYRVKNFENVADLYNGHDALVLPRRYGGLSLTTNEALMAGLPVMMTDISPNNAWLPQDWLVPAKPVGQFKVRAMITYHQTDIQALADKLDQWAKQVPDSSEARKIALEHFKVQTLVTKYKKLL